VAAEGVLGLRALADGEIDPIRIGRPRPLAIAEQSSRRPTLTTSSAFMMAS
jgi:hypothetical protein